MTNILCVDNSDTIRRIVKDCVEDLGFNFFEAENGKECLEKANQIDHLKMIILDWNMPVVSGKETLKKLRETDQYKDVIILVLIKIENKDQVMNVINLGADNYMLKPFSVNSLQNKIDELLK